MPSQLRSVDSVFADAVEVPDAVRRAEYVDVACGGDAALRQRVEELLAAHFRAGSFLEQPAATANFPNVVAETADDSGSTIGPYRLLEQIGEGGMGVVYVADQTEPVRRRVALKVIKPGMDSREVIGRFEAERQALALMDHPNIARVFDGGANGGRPYFVMELVRGLPITDYCDQAKLTAERRLQLFVQVCRAVQHAHQKGVIHRDLKPSNVLVTLHDGEPVPKVIDFGVAKAVNQRLTEKSVYTRFAQMIGTPTYMSPEQAELSALDVDTRSDVYSLGVLLYELLTGTTPFDPQTFREAGFDEMRRIIREDEPPCPSARISTLDAAARSTASSKRGLDERQLSRLLHGDLDWIVMRAMEKDRNRRYESAGALAADIERFLTNEPVEARPPTLWLRTSKWARRHSHLVRSVAAALVVAVVALGVSTALLWKKDEQTQAARRRAEANLRNALAALDRVYLQVIEKRYPGLAKLDKSEQALLQQVLGFYEQFARDNEAESGVRFELAKAYLRVGELRKRLAHDNWQSALTRSSDILRALIQSDPHEADCRHTLALACMLNDQLSEAATIWDRLSEEFPGVYEYRRRAVYARTRYQSAREDAQSTHDLANRLVIDFPGEPTARLHLGESLNLRGNSVWDGGPRYHHESLRHYKDGQAVLEALVAEFPDNDEYIDILARNSKDLGENLVAIGRLSDAEPFLNRAIQLQEALITKNPGAPAVRLELCKSYIHLGRCAKAGGRREDAVQAALRAVAAVEPVRTVELLDKSRHGLTHWSLTLAFDLTNLGEATHARRILEHTIPLVQELNRKHDGWGGQLCWVEMCLAEIARLEGDVRERAAALKRAVALTRQPGLPNAELLRNWALTTLGRDLLSEKNWADAEVVLRECFQLRDSPGADDWSRFDTMSMLGEALSGQANYVEAETMLLRGCEGLLVTQTQIPSQKKIRLIESLERLVHFYQATGRSDQSADWQQKLDSARGKTAKPSQK